MKEIALAVAISLCFHLLSPSAAAQDFDKEMDRPQEAEQTHEEIKEASQAAEEAKAADGANGVTYDQVLADPDNIELNYKYAKSQIAIGNLRGAAATLERILMVDPNLPRVRLTYAIILYRLDSLPEAQRELEALKDLPMPAVLKTEIDAYIKKIKSSRRNTHVTGRLGLGWQYDSNRNAGPASGNRLFLGTPVQLTTGDKRADTSVIVMAHAGLERDLGFQSGHTLNANLSHYRAEQTHLNTLDLQAYNWDLGGTLKSGRYGNLTPRALFGYISLHERTYMRSRGVDFGWEKPVNNRLSLFSGLGIQMQEFINTPDVGTATERTGAQTDFRIGTNILLNPRMRLTLRFQHTDKDARQRFNAYLRESFSASHAWVLGKGTFLLTSFTLNLDVYGEENPAVSAKIVRKDVTTRNGLTFGAPLGLFAKPLRDLLWTLSWEFFQSSGNLIDNDYKNQKINTLLTYKFGT